MAGRTAAEAASEQETLTRDPLMLHRAIVTQDRLCSEMLAAFMCPAPKADCPLTAQKTSDRSFESIAIQANYSASFMTAWPRSLQTCN